jgi:putative ABC transport system ATP-binding protein
MTETTGTTDPAARDDHERYRPRQATAVEPIVQATALTRDFQGGHGVVHALRGIDLSVEPGTFVAITGRSGAGKTTLLDLLGGIDRPTSGRVVVDGHVVAELDDAALVRFRRETVAFVFQSFGLIPFLTAAENVEIPLRLQRTEPDERDARVRELLELVGLGGRDRHRPHELSGGEQQRVSIARALAARPRVLLADEPTGQLDQQTARAIMALLRSAVETEGATAIVATHDPLLLDIADVVHEIESGVLAQKGTPTPYDGRRTQRPATTT